MVDADQGPALRGELAERVHAETAKTAHILRRIRILVARLFRQSIAQVFGLHLGQQDDVESLAQSTLPDIGRLQRLVIDGKLLQYPARPAFVYRGCPRFVDADANPGLPPGRDIYRRVDSHDI